LAKALISRRESIKQLWTLISLSKTLVVALIACWKTTRVSNSTDAQRAEEFVGFPGTFLNGAVAAISLRFFFFEINFRTSSIYFYRVSSPILV